MRTDSVYVGHLRSQAFCCMISMGENDTRASNNNNTTKVCEHIISIPLHDLKSPNKNLLMVFVITICVLLIMSQCTYLLSF